MKKYELVIFDADETLLDFGRAEKCAFEETMKHFNIDYNEKYHLKQYKKINSEVWHELENQLISAEELKTERFRRLFKKLNMDLNPIEANEIYIDVLCKKCFILDEAEDILNYLEGKYKLALMTNGLLTVQNSRIKKSPIAKYFQTIVISEEIGVAKPDPQIFEYTFEKIGHTDKKTALMVGDSLNSDIKGGINFGIDTCWFNPKRLSRKKGLHPTYEINKLSELKSII